MRESSDVERGFPQPGDQVLGVFVGEPLDDYLVGEAEPYTRERLIPADGRLKISRLLQRLSQLLGVMGERFRMHLGIMERDVPMVSKPLPVEVR